MYIKNGIAYAGEQKQPLKISGVRPLEDYKLWVRFSTDEAKVFDFSPLLTAPAFAPLQDKNVFNAVYIDYGCTCWNDGNIDIAPEYLYEHGIADVPTDKPLADEIEAIKQAEIAIANGDVVNLSEVNFA